MSNRSSLPASGEPSTSKPEGERLAKVMARAGVCSRRDAEKLIAEGVVRVNNQKVLTPATFVQETDKIECDGKIIGQAEPTRLWLYHKPAGLVTTHQDPQGRPTVFERLPENIGRVISVGRLDLTSEGLLLLTNDGALSRLLEHPDTGWTRAYRARAFGRINQGSIDKLARGVTVEGERYGPIEVAVERNERSNLWLLIKLKEGKNREVRKALQSVGLEVNRLIRVSYGPFQLGELGRGEVKAVKTRMLATQLGAKQITKLGLRLPTADDDAKYMSSSVSPSRSQTPKDINSRRKSNQPAASLHDKHRRPLRSTKKPQTRSGA